MAKIITRRRALIGAMGSAGGLLAAPVGPVIETHVHLFDPKRVPYAPDAPYKPAAYTLEDHLKLAEAAGLAHSIIVSPEPYQDDHRYLEYGFAHEPRKGYFKGVCLFDLLREDAPHRVEVLLDRWPKRIVAVRVHETKMGVDATGPIKNRDMKDPRMLANWKTLTKMGVGIQMHFIPGRAPDIHALATKSPDTMVILDHMGRPGSGTEKEYDQVLKLAELPRVIMKYSGWDMYHGDLNRLTRRIYDAFGPDRMIWGMLGLTYAEYQKQSARFDQLLAFASEAERTKIRGGNAQRLFFS
ncbi:MAG TPA: amidohydrolase family protein [Bryobacteraceae bacterium]|nr:amidohydrolase family protein [Bryobacteraceae bacterium]